MYKCTYTLPDQNSGAHHDIGIWCCTGVSGVLDGPYGLTDLPCLTTPLLLMFATHCARLSPLINSSLLLTHSRRLAAIRAPRPRLDSWFSSSACAQTAVVDRDLLICPTRITSSPAEPCLPLASVAIGCFRLLTSHAVPVVQLSETIPCKYVR